MSKTDLNKAAETILIPLLNEVYGWNLVNINYIEDDNNYPGIDLVDEVAGIAIQVTATSSLEKVKHTLKQFIKRNQYLKYRRLIVYILKRKKNSYPEAAVQGIIQNKFNFDSQKDIWDYCNILKEVSNFQIDRALRVQEILEAYFGEDQGYSSLLAGRPRRRIDWQKTCRELLSHRKGLTTNALMKRNGVRFQLDEVFVPLGVVERREQPKHSSNNVLLAEQGSELYEAKITPVSQYDFFEQVLRQRQSKYSQGNRIAIIGEPGAGKTTQLQKIGDWILEETDGIPIWIPLAEVGTRKLKEYLLGEWLQTAIQELEVSQAHRDELGQLLTTGKVWLLLDGVDEMAISDALYQISIQMHEGWLRNVRVVLTCRLNVWDVGKNALDGFDVYRNLDFKYPTGVHQFIDQWFATEAALQQKLKVALEQPGKERIRDMVKNPLRLTLLCYSWQLRQGELPETKAGLYEWFMDAFYKWNKGKVPLKLSAAKRDELNWALGELAREAIDQKSSRFRLREKFVNQFLGAANDEDSLFHLALQFGWLNPVGVAEENSLENVYAFFHTTFQEYFAALTIDDWHFFLNHIPESPDHPDASYRIFEPQWREVFLLWLGREEINSSVKEDFLSTLLLFEDRCNNFYWMRLCFLVAESIGEIKKFRFSNLLFWILVKCAFGFDIDKKVWSPVGIPFEGFQDESKRAITLINKRISKKFLEEFIDLVENVTNQDEWILEHYEFSNHLKLQVIKCLIEIDPYSSKAVHNLLQIIQNNLSLERDVFGTNLAIEALEKTKLEPPEPKLFDILIQLCQSNNSEIQKQAIKSIGNIAYKNPKSIEALNELLNSQDQEVVQLAAESLCKIAPADLRAFKILTHIIVNSEVDQLPIRRIFDNLANISGFNLEIKDYLENLLSVSNLREEVICEIAGVLASVDGRNIRALEILNDLLSKSLSRLKENYSATKETMPIIEGVNVFSRFFYPDYARSKYDDLLCLRLCEILNRINKNKEGTVEALIFLINHSDDYIVPIHAASFLLKFDVENPNAIKRLVREIEVNQCFYCMLKLPKIKDGYLKSQAVKALDMIVESDSLEGLNPSINKIEAVKTSAVEALAKLDSENPRSLSRLISLLKQDFDHDLLTKRLDQMLPSNYLETTISELKQFLDAQTYGTMRNLYNNCFKTLWHCAQNMSYPDFHRAWHNPTPSTNVELSTNYGETKP